MKHYPIFLNLERSLCAVFGAGAVAQRKVEGLLRAGARVILVAPRATDQLQSLAEEGAIEWRRREATEEDLDGDPPESRPRLAFLCTDSPETQRRLAEACRRRGIPANVADSPEECDFLVPSVVERGPLQVAVSTGGESPALARALREQIEKQFDAAYEALTRLAGQIRRADIAAGRSAAERRRRLARLLDGRVLEAIRRGGEEAGRQKADEALNENQ